MKSAAALLALIGFVSVSQILGGAIVDVSAKATIGGTFVLKCKTDTAIPQNGFLKVTASRPIFKKGESQAAGLITSSTDPDVNNADTAGTSADGTELVLTFTGAAFAQHANVKTITFAAGVLDTAALGLAAGTVDIDVTASAGPSAAATGITAMIISNTATSFAIGPTAMATSQFKGAAPGDYTFTFFPGTTINTGSTLTITADQPIFTASAASASAPIKVLSQFVPTAAGTLTAVSGTHTCVTDADGKVLTITLGGALTAEQKTVLTMQTVMASNPATASMVTISIDASAGSTTATSVAYPIFDKANEILFVGAAIDTNKVLKTETTTKITMDIVPQVAVAANKIITLTASEAIWAAAAAVTCGIVEHGGTSITAYATCEASTTSVLKVTIAANYALAAKTRYTIEATSNIAANKGSAAVVTFKVDSDTTDNVESAATYGYAIFNAATTSAWISGVVTPLSATSTPTSLAVTFVPHTAAVGGTDKATITASTAIFTASQTAVTEACTTFTTYPKSVTCTAATDATGKILTVTLSGTAGDNFLANAKSTITITDKLVANAASGTATTFAFETSKDTTGITAQTGYTTTAAPVASSSANATASAAAATGTETTVTQVYTFADLTVAAYTGKMKSNCECAYANTVEGASTPTWCVATTSAYTYKSGVTMSSTAAARRAAKVTFVLKVKSSVKTTSQLQTLVASGSTATAFATALTAVNTASNYTAAPGTATVATATFTGGSSSASTLLPSMLSLVAAIFVAARQ